MPISIMAQGRGSALLTSLLLCILALSCTTITQAKQYTVGDASGWELMVDYTKWAAKYKFVVGDTLLFTYSAEQHDVYQVSQADYNACDISKPIKMWADGSTTVTLADATTYYFVCGIPGHCAGGMKVAVTATGGSAGKAPAAAPPAKAPASTPPAKAPTAKAPVSTPPAKAPVSTPPAKAPAKAPVSKAPSPSPAAPTTSTPTPSPSSPLSPAPSRSSPSTSPVPSPPSPAAAPSNTSTPRSSSHALASPQFLLFSVLLGSLLLPFC